MVQMKCPNCRGEMHLINGQFTCPFCRTTLLNIVDAKIDADVTVMSPDEFAKKIEESKRQFVVNINDNLQVFDINTMVINKKIKDATHALDKGNFDDVLDMLDDIDLAILSVERLRFLADFKVKNEYELSFYDGYIDNNHYFKNVISLADEQTKATYQKLAEYCRDRYDTKKRIEAEIKEVEKLLSVQLYQEAVAYVKEMCRKYPQTALSWAYSCEVKCHISNNYNCEFEFSMMEKCPDYQKVELTPAVEKKIESFKGISAKYDKARIEFRNGLGYLTGCLWGALITTVMYVSLAERVYIIAWLFLLGGYITIGASIVFTIKLIGDGFQQLKARKNYNYAKKLIPSTILKKYALGAVPYKKFFTIALELWFITVGILIYLLTQGIITQMVF